MIESFCREPHERFHLGNATSLLYWGDRVSIQPDTSATLLARCDSYQTLDEHVRAFMEDHARDAVPGESLPWAPGPPAAGTVRALSDIRSRLESLVDAGLLTSHSDAIRRCLAAAAKPAEPASIASLGVVTSGRTSALERCVSSYALNLRNYGRDAEIIVMDDSKDAAIRERNREALRALHARYGVRMSYGGFEQKEAYIAALLAHAGLPSSVVRFGLSPDAINPRTCGANRNALQLATAGQLTVSVDDDTVCRLAPHPQSKDRLSLADPNEFGDVHFFPGKEEAIAFASPSEQDFLALHELFLGKSLGHCVQPFGFERTDVSMLSARLARSLRDQKGELSLTSLGLLGDSGLRSPHWFLFYGRATRERLLESEKTYRLATRSRQVFRTVTCPTITDRGGWMAYCMGMDNRKPLPPFMPLCRTQDSIFMRTLMQCHAQAWVGHIPVSVFHDPPEARNYEVEDMAAGVARVLTGDLVNAVINAASLANSMSQVSLKFLGGFLMEIGSLPMREYHDYVRHSCWRSFHLCVSELEEQLEAGHAVEGFWRKDTEEQIERVRKLVTVDTFPTSDDLLPGGTVEERRAADRQFIHSLGALYYHWYDIVGAAKELHQKGRYLPEQVA